MTKIMVILLVHIIGAIVSLVWDLKVGNFEYAIKHGDGVRIATPADIVFYDVCLWEFKFLVYALELILYSINNMFYKKYANKNEVKD